MNKVFVKVRCDACLQARCHNQEGHNAIPYLQDCLRIYKLPWHRLAS
jgi:hypothetical protein